MSLFSAEARQLRLQAQQSSASSPYPLDVPVQFDVFLHRLHQGEAFSDNGGLGLGALQGDPDNSRHDHQEPSDLQGQRPAESSQHDQQEPSDLQGSPRPKFPPSPPSHFCESSSEIQDWGQEHGDGRSVFDFLRDGGSARVQAVQQEQDRGEVQSPSFSHVSEVGCEAEWYDRVRDLLNPPDDDAFDPGKAQVEQDEQEGLLHDPSLLQMVAEPNPPVIEGRLIEKSVASEISRSALPSPTFPWERGVFRSIFGSEDPSNPFDSLVINVPGPLLPTHSPAAAVSEPRPPIPTLDIASRAFGAFQDLHPSHERDQLMDRAVCKLQLIVGRCNKSRLSSELSNALEAASPQVQLQETIAACVGLRSPHTVLKRANAILAFLRWADKEDTLEPLSEGTVWDFFSWLKREGAPPSRAVSLMSAFRFVNFVLGVSLQDLLYSRRLCGLSIQLGVQKTSASRARPLTVNEIKYLHRVLEDSRETSWDRAIAGYLLLALYARARHSDFLQVEEVIPDFGAEGDGYLEVRLRVHKTAQTLAKRNDLLPVIVAARSIKEGDWLGFVSTAFSRVGLSLEGTVRAGLFRPCKPGGSEPGNRSLRSSECTAMLKLMLQRCGSDTSLVRSHSLKRTILDWGSKFCIDDAVLALLGRHSKCVRGSVPVYAREESLRAVKAIEPMLRAIADGSFKPDASRADYFPKAPLPIAGDSAPLNTMAPETKVEVIDDSDQEPCEEALEVEGSGSSSTSSGAVSESSESEEPAPKVPRVLFEAWDHESCLANAKTHTLHLLKHVSGGGTMIAVCGRASSNLVKARVEHMRYSRCRVCLKIGPPKDD